MWLADAIAEDDFTDGHVDNVVAFTADGTVLLQGCDDDSNPNAAIAAGNRDRLARGRPRRRSRCPVLPYTEYAGRSPARSPT